MNFTPSTPAYEDMRDGILAAMPTQAEDCIVWQAFAQFGIGEGADGQVSPTFQITESFAVPSSCTTPPPNTAPTVTITAPAAGSSFQQNTPVTFTGTATDAEQGDLSANLVWTSNTQGSIGTGGSFTTSGLAVGTHIITAAVTDAGGLQGTATRTIMITSTSPPVTITLSASGYKVKGTRHAGLNWTGATTSVDVYRDNVKISASPIPGSSYTDVIGGKGPGTFNYKVCHAGTASCSNISTVVF